MKKHRVVYFGSPEFSLPPLKTLYLGGYDIVGIYSQEPKKKFYGLQFHPEVEHTQKGSEIIKNFLFGICKCKADWDMDDFVHSSVEDIRTTVGEKQVILGLSGGVDSSVAAALIDKAIGTQLTCIFVDNGLLRLNEREEVIKLFKDH